MLIRAKAYTGNVAEITYDPAVYADSKGSHLCLESPAQYYSRGAVIKSPSRALRAIFRLCGLPIAANRKNFEDVDQATPIVRHLAFENANRYCQEAIHPHKNKSLNGYLKFCRDI